MHAPARRAGHAPVEEKSGAAIRTRGLFKRYDGKPPVEAVCGLDLDVQTGECFGLLGPNGAGKTTTIEILEGLLPPTSGDVEILGMRWGRDSAALRQRIGISLQETRLADRLTVEETIGLFASFFDKPRLPREVIDTVELGEKVDAWVVNLSGGQRQRLAVACALVGDPDLLFLDEPTTGLDPQSRRQLWDVVGELRRRGRTTLLTTHYMDEAERLCDRVAIVDHGKVIALGSPAELISSLGGEHVVEFALRDDQEVDLDGVPAIRTSHQVGAGYQLAVAAPHVTIPALLERLTREGRTLSRLTTRQASLEDVFVHLTGRRLRDE